MTCLTCMTVESSDFVTTEPEWTKVPILAEAFDLQDVQMLDMYFKQAQTINRDLKKS